MPADTDPVGGAPPTDGEHGRGPDPADAARARARRWFIGTATGAVAVVVVVALLARGGGGGGGGMPGMDMGGTGSMSPATSASADAAPEPSRDPESVSLTLRDAAIEPGTIELAPGAYTFTALNSDDVTHDVVLIRTDLAIDDLPVRGSRVDEAALDVRARTSAVPGGERGSLSARLDPGRYLLVCTMPEHFVRDRMVAEVLVSDV